MHAYTAMAIWHRIQIPRWHTIKHVTPKIQHCICNGCGSLTPLWIQQHS